MTTKDWHVNTSPLHCDVHVFNLVYEVQREVAETAILNRAQGGTVDGMHLRRQSADRKAGW